jgi:hypothetical protein
MNLMDKNIKVNENIIQNIRCNKHLETVLILIT